MKTGEGQSACDEITGFKITDNGIGFTDDNMNSFHTLDSEYKADKGCRGVGRLLWLKAFKNVDISSVHKNHDGMLQRRTFKFNANSGVDDEKTTAAPASSTPSTTVHLSGFVERYRAESHKTTHSIANSLFEHCLWCFVREGSAPVIQIKDDDESINLEDIYRDHMVTDAVTEKISIREIDFEIIHIKLRAASSKPHNIAFCASNRLVKEENLTGKAPGLYGKLTDENGDFTYICYVCSSFLDENVRSERTSFDIPESSTALLAKGELSFSEIRDEVVSRVTTNLAEALQANIVKSIERIEDFVSKKAPRYRPIMNRIPKDKLNVDPNSSNKDLELVLHKYLAEIESELISDGHDVMVPKTGEDEHQYHERIKEYLDRAEDIKKSDLASYVSHRKVVLDILEMAIQKNTEGGYAREDLIHNLIMPMRNDSNGVMSDSCNLWLIDERLAFHNYLASDKTLSSMPITSSTETKEPDICGLNIYDNPILASEGNRPPLASIDVIEIKRPMRNDASGEGKDPIEQAIDYLERIRKGTVQTASGRLIPNSEDIPGYCYIICDLTPSVEKRCERWQAKKTSDGLGYFFYHEIYKAYVEVISFDRLVNKAKERNRAFFDRLGLPTT